MTATVAIPSFYRLFARDEVTSTNDEALALAAAGAEEGALVVADRQTRGRGRRGRSWDSPAGNLHLSLVLTPPAGPSAAGAVGFAGSLAAADAVARFLPAEAEVGVKWPNDVLVGDRKVGGILIETVAGRAEALVLGVGVNVARHPAGTTYPATSLAAEGAATATAPAVLEAFAESFLERYRGWRRDGMAPLRAAWLARARGIGGPIRARLEGATFDGLFRGIDESGALVLDLGDGDVKRITAGDVFLPGRA